MTAGLGEQMDGWKAMVAAGREAAKNDPTRYERIFREKAEEIDFYGVDEDESIDLDEICLVFGAGDLERFVGIANTARMRSLGAKIDHFSEMEFNGENISVWKGKPEKKYDKCWGVVHNKDHITKGEGDEWVAVRIEDFNQ